MDEAIAAAAKALKHADALLIGAGAGMGVDSGLPDFRGPEGFWRAYPAFRGKQFAEISTPHWFETDPTLAWGFFGHRLGLYRQAEPHLGFKVLLQWGERLPYGAFVFTSNVDGQFQRARFAAETVFECHGSIHHLQCTRNCGRGVWSAEDIQVGVDEVAVRATSELPRCSDCGALARPNILMFQDWRWDSARSQEQFDRYQVWLRAARGKRVIAIEIGAGTTIPTVRDECESRAVTLVRINPHDAATPPGGIAIRLGAYEALRRIDEAMG